MMPPKFILSLFTIRVFASCFIFQFFRWGVIFFTVLYMHNYLHYSTLFTAIGMLPLIAITLVIPFINLLLSKKQLNERFILVAYVILFLAALLYLLFLPVPPYYAIAILYVMIGIADAWGYTLTNVLAELSVTKNEFARLKSNMKLQHRLGGVFGLVVLTLISQSFVFHHFDHVVLHNVVVSHAMRLKIMSYVGRNLSPSILHQHFSMISLQAWHYFNVLFLHSIRIIFYILAIMVFLYLIFLTCCVMYKQYQCRHASN